jgi:Tol biopolymer transport system component
VGVLRTNRSALLATALAVAVGALVLAGSSSSSTLARAKRATSSAVLRTLRANISTHGKQADSSTSGAVVSADGRFVAFSSRASTLVADDTNKTPDVFVRDLELSTTVRASVGSDGTQGNGESLVPSISANGDLVAFPSRATNLVRNDVNGYQDVFVRDRATGTTTLASVGQDGPANGRSLASYLTGDGSALVFSSDASNLVRDDRNASMDVFLTPLPSLRTRRINIGVFGESTGRTEASSVSNNGRVVCFRSFSPNLVGHDVNGRADVFVFDRRTDTTTLGNVSSTGAQANGATFRGMLSGDGRYVGFRSRADNLVPGDTNDALDVFEHDRLTGATMRISVASDGTQADASGLGANDRYSMFMSRPFLSRNGRFAVFTSRASNLVPDDTNGQSDVFVHDLETGRTVRVSVGPGGAQANGASFSSGISADGRVVVFTSYASNLVPGDTNGRKDVFVASLWPATPRGGIASLTDPLGGRARITGNR